VSGCGSLEKAGSRIDRMALLRRQLAAGPVSFSTACNLSPIATAILPACLALAGGASLYSWQLWSRAELAPSQPSLGLVRLLRCFEYWAFNWKQVQAWHDSAPVEPRGRGQPIGRVYQNPGALLLGRENRRINGHHKRSNYA
jgi:hypothetical protein